MALSLQHTETAMPRITHFEIHADDPERAAAFYRNVFEWNITKWGGGEYWLATTGPDNEPGINGGIIRRQGQAEGMVVPSYVCSIQVPSVEEYLERVTAHGGSVVAPRSAVPGVGWLAYGRDTEGNMFAMFQDDTAAA